MGKSRMFPFITETWNPLGGMCPHDCTYCWAKQLTQRFKYHKYEGHPFYDSKHFGKMFKPNSFVFVCTMIDLFADDISEEFIFHVYAVIKENWDSKFLLQTKNPKRYVELHNLGYVPPQNAILGVTIESDRNYTELSNAPKQFSRLLWMTELKKCKNERADFNNDFFVSIEPILDFDWSFITGIYRIRPWAVAVGYDNYNHKLPEPYLEKTLGLIKGLKEVTIVYEKTLRRAWNEHLLVKT